MKDPSRILTQKYEIVPAGEDDVGSYGDFILAVPEGEPEAVSAARAEEIARFSAPADRPWRLKRIR